MLSLSLIHSVVSCHLFLVVSASFPIARPPYSLPLPPSGLFIPSATPQTRVQLLGLNTQFKATMPQLALAAWDNYFFPLVRRVICCHWYRDMWKRTLMIYFLRVHSNWWMPKLTTLAFPVLECTLNIFTNEFMEL